MQVDGTLGAPIKFLGAARGSAYVNENGYVGLAAAQWPYDPRDFGGPVSFPMVCVLCYVAGIRLTCTSISQACNDICTTSIPASGRHTGRCPLQVAPFFCDIGLTAAQDSDYNYIGDLMYRLSDAQSADATAAASLVQRGFASTSAAFQSQNVLVATW
jgi:hypothetical protein